MNQPSTTFLVPRSSYFTGAGTIWNISGFYYRYNRSQTPAQADMRALRSDWRMVGQDIASALCDLEEVVDTENAPDRQLRFAFSK